MPMYRLRVELGAFPGAGGLNTWWFKGDGGTTTDADQVGTALRAFYAAIDNALVNDMTVSIQPSLDTFDEATGVLSGAVAMTSAPAVVEGNGAGSSLSRASQLKLRFLTGSVSDGRRVAGGIYLGPSPAEAFSTDGQVQTTIRNAITTALGTFRDALTGNLQHAVYQQPRDASGGLPQRDGSGYLVTTYAVKTLPAVLRSRRD